MLARLRHRAVGRRNDEDRAVHLRRAGDHVLDVVGVTGAIDVRVVALRRLVLLVRDGDRDAAFLFLGRVVDVVDVALLDVGILGCEAVDDGRRQRRLAVVDVTRGPDVDVRFRPFKFGFSHDRFFVPSVSSVRPYAVASFFPDALATISSSTELRRFLVARELHRVRRAALSRGTHVGGVPEHLRERDVRGDDHGAAGRFFLRLDLAAPPVQVAVDRAEVILGRRHFDFHDRLEQDRTGLLVGVLERHRGRDLEGHFRRVDVVIRTVVERRLEVEYRVAGQRAGLARFANALLDRLDVFLGNGTADDFVLEDVAGAGRQRLETDPHVAVLALAARLADELALHFDCLVIASL